MGSYLNLSNELVELAKPYAIAEGRSVSAQIEYWARLGKVAEENPDLSVSFIKDTLLGLAEASLDNVAEYKFDA